MNSKELLSFLFCESQIQQDIESIAEDAADVYDKMDRLEKLEVKQKPLEKILRDMGVEGGELDTDEHSEDLCLHFDNECEYSAALDRLFDPAEMHNLASAGWLATRCGEQKPTDQEPCWKVRFVSICGGESPKKDDKEADLEELIKTAQEFAATAPDRPDAGVKPAPKDGMVARPKGGKSGEAVKKSIRDSMDDAAKVVEHLLENK